VSSKKRKKRRSVGGEARNAVSRKLHQDGSWTIRGQGTHCCEYREYAEQADGKYKPVRRFKSFHGFSERAAHEAMQPILAAVNAANKALAERLETIRNGGSRPIPRGAETLVDVVNEWRKLVAPNHKPKGREASESHLRAHILPKLGTMPLAELSVKTLQQFVMDSTPGRSGKTVENILITLTGILAHARKWGMLVPQVSLSDLSMPEKVKPQPKFYEPSEIKRLLAVADDPLRTILYVLVLTGMRINEALALRLEDLDFTRKLIHVRHSVYNGTLGTPKSAASVADLHMPPELEKRLQAFIASAHYRKNDLGLLFCNRRNRPYSDNKLREKALRPLLISLKMRHTGKAFHAIRHSVGSVMLDAGEPLTVVRDQLRHSDVRITLGVYGHVIGNSQRNAVNRLAKRLIA
jgi:integrase